MKDKQSLPESEKPKMILKLNKEQRKMVQEGLDDYKRGNFLTTEEMFRDLLDDDDEQA